MSQSSPTTLAAVADEYARTIVAAVQREYPNAIQHLLSGPDDRPTPRQAHPAFYGCLDWHSAVEMHWALVRLLRLVPGAVSDVGAAVAVLDEHLTVDALAAEDAYLREHPWFERPYGWGWLLTLADELHDTADAGTGWPSGRREAWADAVRPLALTATTLMTTWLQGAAHPDRDGRHANTAFALARSLPWARRLAAEGDPALLHAITTAARRFYAADRDGPAGYEPCGADFLSPVLTEAELMLGVLDGEEYVRWLDGFLPGLAEPGRLPLGRPVVVGDETDGQGAHLHGLNLSRAGAQRRVAERLGPDDPRTAGLLAVSDAHAQAGLAAVVGRDWMVEHWLAAFAVLLLAPRR